MSKLDEKIHNLPQVPGVYLFLDARGEVLYVGKAKSLAQRVRNYLASDLVDPRLREMVSRATDLDAIVTGTEVEALLLEASLVRQHRPHFNIVLKDDKSFPYVKVSVQEPFPRVSITRQVKDDGARYLGPYTDVKVLRRMLREIRRVFPVRTCRNFEEYQRSNRPCLYFHIRRCTGPCTTRTRVSPEEYRRLVDGLILFLGGRDDELVRRLRADMAAAAEARQFERAARLRDQIALLDGARAPQNVVRRGGRDTDVLGVARHGRHTAIATLVVRGGRIVGKESRLLAGAEALDEAQVLYEAIGQHYLHLTDVPRRFVTATEPADGAVLREALARRAGHEVAIATPLRGRERRLVAAAERNAALTLEDLEARSRGRRARFSSDVLELQRALDLRTPPHLMVCFDISNTGAEHAVAAIVASENGRTRRSLYRRMRIRRPGPDDFAMIGEAVERYWARVESEELPRPDLVVIDGGLGQVRAARAALDRASTQPVALIGLAKEEETIVRERGPDLRLPRRSPALRMLQRLRDEAHRFGLTYHRLLRGRARVASALDAIAGVGPARRAALLRAFGSVAALAEADAADIAARARVPRALAERVRRALRPDSAPPSGSPAAAAPEFVRDEATGADVVRDAPADDDDPPRRAAGGERHR